MGEWIEWSGGKCPAPPLAEVEVKFRAMADGPTLCAFPERLRWDHVKGVDGRRGDGDIVAYRITTPSPRPQHGGGAA